MGEQLPKWIQEKRDELGQDFHRNHAYKYMGTPDFSEAFDYGFNAAMDLVREIGLVEALARVDELKEISRAKNIQGETAKGMYGTRVENRLLVEGKLMSSILNQARETLAHWEKGK